MKGYLYIIIFALIALAGVSVRAQSGRTTPTPTPTATPTPANLNAVPEIAPNYRSEDRTLPEIGLAGVDIANQRALTLREAIELALDNNRDIEVSRKTEHMAEFDLRAARGFYQPRLTGQSYYDSTTAPNVSIFSTNQKTTQGTLLGNAALQAYVPKEGTVFTGSFNNQRVTSDNPISILSPQLNTSLGFAAVQPLFRGRLFDQPRRAIEIAKRNIDISDTQFRQRAIETVAAVQRGYWDLTFALRNLQVQRDAVRDARDQLEHNRRLVQEGQLAPIDVVAAETQVANFEQAVYDALNTVSQAENALKNLISPNRADAIWAESLTPIEPVEVPVPDPTVMDAITTAIDKRPELTINKYQKDLNLIDQRLYRDQKKPQIDFTASYASTGVGGSENPAFHSPFPLPCTTDPTSPACQSQLANLALLTGNPLGGVFANRYPVFRVGINFNIPLFGDKTASAQLGHAIVEGERLEVQREQIEQNIQVDVRNAVQSIRTAEARLRAAAIARENTAKQYESEQRKLDNGQSDVYRVLDRQTALSAARSNELRARTELNKAIAELQRATGNSLEANDVEVKLTK
jgi:outer membrane protein